jgi:FdhD protein
VDSVLTAPICKFDFEVPAASALEEQDFLAVEEPLQIRIGSRDLAVTMRTPGNDAELTAGFLFTEGLIRKIGDITDIRCERNTAVVTLASDVQIDSSSQRNFYVTSSCGVCGKASIEALEKAGCTRLSSASPQVTKTVIRSIPEKLGESQAVFKRTGGLHASALFSSQGELVVVREDVGRHNALDKLIGRALLDGRLPLHEYILAVSGRTSFELLQKAVMAGIPVLAAVGAPSSLAVKTALRFGVTLIGFLREDRFNVYSAPHRIQEQT